jgi:hypothetical protein
MADPSRAFYKIDSGSTFAGATIASRLTREVLPIDKDPLQFKYIKRIYPKILASAGVTIQVYLGGQDTLMDPITWLPPKSYTVGTDRFINVTLRAPLISIRFETTAQMRFLGYDIEYDNAGLY